MTQNEFPFGRFVVVPAAYLYLLRTNADGGTEVLLQQRGDVPFMAGHWAAAAAGHIERGESAFTAVAREAAEELGITDVAVEFLTTMHRTHNDLPIDERFDLFFTARSWSGEPSIQEAHKAADLGWFAIDALPSPMVPHEAVMLAQLYAELSGGPAVPAYVAQGFK